MWASFLTGEVQAFYEDLNGRQYMNEVFNFSVDKLYDLLFTDSQFQRDFMEQRRFSGKLLLAKPRGGDPCAVRGPVRQQCLGTRLGGVTVPGVPDNALSRP